MKRILFLILCTWLVLSNVQAAPNANIQAIENANNQSVVSVNNKSEEDICFDILTEKLQTTYSINLANVEYEDWVNVDMSTYDNFKNYTVENPEQKYLKNSGLNIFAAKRNNIWTIKANWDYILSQFTGFGNKTNFTFPLKSKNEEYITGDEYPEFKQNIVYTHHLLDGTFVSCGFLNVNPQEPHHLQSVAQSDYKTNTFEWSWFELLESSIKKEWKDWEQEFLVWKVSVSADDYADEDLFKIKLLTVAYNNKSSYFNEFETFPKQVATMTNADAQNDGMSGVMKSFLNKVRSETCLELVHASGFPVDCGWWPKSLSLFSKVIAFFIPSAHAKIDPVENYEEKMQQARGLVIYDGFPLELHDKIESIPNTNLRDALILAILPNFIDVINNKKELNVVLSPYEEVFSQCNMTYSQRSKNVIDFVKQLDIENIDYENFTYLDEKFWDCVIPYPDKKNIWKAIPKSFSDIELIDETEDVSSNNEEKEDTPLIDAKYAEILELEKSFNEQNELLQTRIDKWELISNEEIANIKTERITFETEHVKLQKELDDLIINKNQPKQELEILDWEADDIDQNNKIKSADKNILNYVLGILFILLGWILMYPWIRKTKKS